MASPQAANRDESRSIVTRHWLIERSSKRIFAYAAIAAMLVCILALAANLMPEVEIDKISKSPPLEIIGVLLALVMIPSALWLWLGMDWYWLRLDSSPRRPKTLWFLILLLLNWIGAIAYYFAVYRKEWRGPREADRVLNAFPIFLSCLFVGAIPFLYLFPSIAASRLVELPVFIVGLLVVVPTTVVLLIRLCRHGMRFARR